MDQVSKQRISPFYHDSLTTTTDRTPGLLLQSDRLVFGTIKERLADGDVVVVEVIGGPLLARGLVGVFDISLCDEVVVGLIHDLREARSRPGCHGPQQSCTGCLPTTSWKMKVSGKRKNGVIRETVRKEKK